MLKWSQILDSKIQNYNGGNTVWFHLGFSHILYRCSVRNKGGGEVGRPESGFNRFLLRSQDRTSRMTSPWTSVNRRSRPLW